MLGAVISLISELKYQVTSNCKPMTFHCAFKDTYNSYYFPKQHGKHLVYGFSKRIYVARVA